MRPNAPGSRHLTGSWPHAQHENRTCNRCGCPLQQEGAVAAKEVMTRRASMTTRTLFGCQTGGGGSTVTLSAKFGKSLAKAACNDPSAHALRMSTVTQDGWIARVWPPWLYLGYI